VTITLAVLKTALTGVVTETFSGMFKLQAPMTTFNEESTFRLSGLNIHESKVNVGVKKKSPQRAGREEDPD